MRSTRSGALPRLLPYRSPEYWVMASELFVFEFLFGLLRLIACVIAFSSCGMSAAEGLLDPRAPIYRLSQPLDAVEKARHVIRAGGTLKGETEVCLLVHEYKSGKNWHEDFREVVGDPLQIATEYEAGSHLQTPGDSIDVDWKSVRFEPPMVREESDRESSWRQHVSIPAGGRLYEACLQPRDRVFIDACEVRKEGGYSIAGPCGGVQPVVTTGDITPAPRIDHLASVAAGEISLLGGAALLVLLYLWRALGARPFAEALIKRLGREAPRTLPRSALWVIGLAPIALLIALWIFYGVIADAGSAKVGRYGYAAAYGIIAFAVILGVLARDRRRALGAAITRAREALLGSVAHLKQGQPVALEAEIDPRTDVTTAPLTGNAHAHWAVSVTRIYRSGRNYSASVEPEQRGPSLLALRAPGGPALLDLSDAVVDLRARRVIAKRRAVNRGDHAAVLRHVAATDGAYVLEERFLDPGEAIYIAGGVKRLEAPSVEAGYRESASIPVIGSTESGPLVVHAGTRRSMLRSLLVERGMLGVTVAVAGAVAVTTAGLIAYFVSL